MVGSIRRSWASRRSAHDQGRRRHGRRSRVVAPTMPGPRAGDKDHGRGAPAHPWIVVIRLTQGGRPRGRALKACRPTPLGAPLGTIGPKPASRYGVWGRWPQGESGAWGATPLGEAESRP